jgi:hypothetical protein
MQENKGFCDAVLLDEYGITFHGWAASGGAPASGFDLLINGKPVAVELEFVDRPDVRRALSVDIGLHGYVIRAEAAPIYEEMNSSIEIFARFGDHRWGLIMRPGTNHLKAFDWETEKDFLHGFQNPAFRTTNKAHQVHGACKAATVFRHSKYTLAAAYCLLIYRNEELPAMVERTGGWEMQPNSIDQWRTMVPDGMFVGRFHFRRHSDSISSTAAILNRRTNVSFKFSKSETQKHVGRRCFSASSRPSYTAGGT